MVRDRLLARPRARIDKGGTPVGAVNSRMRQSTVGPAGDPARAAEILVRVAKRRDIPEHLALGVNAVESSIAPDERLLADDRKWQQVGRSAEFSEPYPPGFQADG